jgi:hypothetical protein
MARRRTASPPPGTQGHPKLLGHSSIQTTGDIYADWDIDQLARTLCRRALTHEDE